MAAFENPYAGLLKLMRAQGSAAAGENKTACAVGTLTSISPIAVTVLGMELDAEDIRVNDDLINNEYVKLTGADVGKSVLLLLDKTGQKFYLVCKLA